MKRVGFFLFFVICFSTGLSQKFPPEFFLRKPHERDPGNQKMRKEHFSKVREDSAVADRNLALWSTFEKSKSKMLLNGTSAVANWQSCGPNNQAGCMISHAFDPNNPSVVWAGSAGGGLWKSLNSGNSWQPMTDDLPSISVGAVAINPQNSNEMLIGTGEGYLLSPWLHYGSGVFRSIDGGLTWLPTGLIVPDSSGFASLSIEWDPTHSNNVLLASTHGIYRSQDGGLTWSQKLPGVASSLVMNKKDPSIAYAAMQDYQTAVGGIFMSQDSGKTWAPLAGGLPTPGNYGFSTLAICDSFPNVMYVGISYHATSTQVGEMEGLYKTSNGGITWSKLSTFEDFYCYPAPFNSICQGWYANITAVSPVDSNLVFSGGIYLYNSTDGGQTWNYSDWVPGGTPPYMHPDHHSFGFNPLNPTEAYSFNDGGVYRSTNAGGTWTIVNNDLVTTQFYYVASSATNPNLMLGGSQDNGVFSTYNLNSSMGWNVFQHGDGFFCNVDYTDPNVWYATELYSKRMKSRDGGASWDSINNGISGTNFFVTPLIMHPTVNTTLLAATVPAVYISQDSGASWGVSITTPYITIMAYDKVNPQVIYICNDPYFSVSNIRRSLNGGQTWSLISSPGDKVIDIECDPITSGVLYATRGKFSAGQQIYKSINFGNTWTNITTDFPGIPANTLVVNPNNTNHLYVGCDLGVYLSVDGGTSWTSYNDNLPNVVVNDMHYYAPDSTLRAGTYGRGVWKTKAADPALVGMHENTSLLNSRIFPNPTTGTLTLTGSLEKEQDLEITVLNYLAQEVNEIYSGKMSKGTFALNWTGKNKRGLDVSPGIYFIRISGEQGSSMMKVVVQR